MRDEVGSDSTVAAIQRSAEFDSFPLLEKVRKEEETWVNLAPRYGVTNPDPPWKVSLHATCECLAAGQSLPSLERRGAEDTMADAIYSGTSGPELQLLALADTMLRRGLLREEDLAERMNVVRARLEAAA